MVGRSVARSAFGLLVVVASTEIAHAHKPITSKYTYNEHVFPIVRDRCGRCHASGGVAPMSLLTYQDAYPWADALTGELLMANLAAPQTKVPAFVREAHRRLSTEELDVIVTWATGGTPQGDLTKKPPIVVNRNEWLGGTPDLVLPMPVEFVLPAGTIESTQEFVLPTGLTADRLVRAVDLLPGTPKIVREALIYVKGKDAPSANVDTEIPAERVLAAWAPRQDPTPVTRDAPFRLQVGTELVLRVHYKKTYKDEETSVTDRSTVGLYIDAVGPPARER